MHFGIDLVGDEAVWVGTRNYSLHWSHRQWLVHNYMPIDYFIEHS